jgi:hypothetical protein
MSIAQVIPSAPQLSVALAEAEGAGRTAASSGARATAPAGFGASSPAGVPILPWLGGGATLSAPVSWLVSALVDKGSGAGYAKVATSSAAKSGSGTKATGEWSFLSDPSLSVEEKLSRFMMAVQKKLDDELTDKMDDYKAKYGEGGTETKKEDGGFFGNLLGAILPGIGGGGGLFDSLFGGLGGMLGDALKSFGGPLLAALASAVGLPMLAPAAMKVGESLGGALAGALKGTTAKGGSSSSTKTGGSTGTKSTTTAGKTTSTSKPTSTSKSGSTTQKGEAGSPDERLEMLEIQRLVEKQNQLFTLVSNLMKGMHDTAMVAVQNVR